MGTSSSSRHLLLLPAFVLSGYAALTYEMSWLRQLVSLFGVTYFAITTILTVFMGGIALGSVVGGRLVDRLRVDPLVAFAGLEIFLALYAQLFPHVLGLVDGLYLEQATGSDLSFTTHAMLRFIGGALILAPPTLAAGATLPVACKAFVQQDDGIGAGVSSLYGANLLGATVGCFATTFFTIGLLGFPLTATIGSIANLSAAALALIAWRVYPSALPAESPRTAEAPPVWNVNALVIGSAYFTVGFCALGLEILWTRCFSQFGFNPATYVFGLILVTFLCGHGLGSLVVFKLLIKRFSPHRLFVGLQVGMALSTLVAVLLMWPRPGTMASVQVLRQMGIVLPFERTLLIIPAILLPAMCSGSLFPLASHLSIRGRSGLGRGVGSLSALSTSGGIVGAFLVGFWLMPALGAVRCLLLIALAVSLSAVWSSQALRVTKPSPRRSVSLSVGLIAAAAVLLWVIPPYIHLILFSGERIEAFREGRNSSTAIVAHPSGIRFLLIHGERVAGGGSDPRLAAALHPDAKQMTILGLGSGRVVASALGIEQYESVRAVDIDGNLPDLVPLLMRAEAERFADERFEFVEDDGRHFLLTTDQTFDILINDAALYAWYLELSTLEFNQLAKSRLNPEGLYIGRLHNLRITDEALRREVATFLAVFPNTVMYRLSEDILMLVGRNGDGALTLPRGMASSHPPLHYTTAELHALAEGATLIYDDYPLHLPHTFHPHDNLPIIEYTVMEEMWVTPPESPDDVPSGAKRESSTPPSTRGGHNGPPGPPPSGH
ncbi:MAG: spermidine synthase [Myxococcota bacterium]